MAGNKLPEAAPEVNNRKLFCVAMGFYGSVLSVFKRTIREGAIKYSILGKEAPGMQNDV